MPKSPGDFLKAIRKSCARGEDPFVLFEEHMRRLDRTVGSLASHPFAPWIRVFGSAVDRPDDVPRDIDIFVDLAEVRIGETDRMDALVSYRNLGRGILDPFVLTGGVLMSRTDARAAADVAWKRVPGHVAGTILEAARAGVPLFRFDRAFNSQFNPREATAPRM